MHGKGALIGLCLTIALVAEPVKSETSSLSPAADTSLFEPQHDFNFGAQDDLPSGTLGAGAATLRSRLLLRFDLASSLPTNAVIRSASLRMTVTRSPDGGGVNSRFALHRVLRAWGEGQRKGTPPGGAKAASGDATWNARFFPDELWGKPGGEPGIDYSVESSSSERILQTGNYEFEFGPDQLVEMSQWLREPESNFGWMLISQLESEPLTSRRFASREHANPEMRPRLTVEFNSQRTINAPKITGISIGANSVVTVRFMAASGVRYRLEFIDDLILTPWKSATALVQAGTDGELSLLDQSDVVERRFYRVLATE